MGEIKSLTAIRGLAAFGILLFHAQYLTDGLPDDKVIRLDIFHQGFIFVDLFFILSGFIISYVYGEQGSSKIIKEYPRFLALRLFRVYPVHFFMLIIFLVYELLKRYVFRGADQIATADNTGFGFLTNLLLIQSWDVDDALRWNTPAWSISAEFAAYIVSPLLFIIFLDSKKPIAVVGAIASLGTLVAIYKIRNTLDLSFDYGVLRCVSEFSIGIALFRIFRENRPSVRRFFDTSISIFLVATIVSVMFTGLDLITVVLFCGDVLGLAVARGRWIAFLMTNKIAMFLGKISYSLYMVHLFIFERGNAIFRRFFSDSGSLMTELIFVSVEMAIAIAAATMMFHWIEEPGRKAGRRLLGGARSRDEVSGGAALAAGSRRAPS